MGHWRKQIIPNEIENIASVNYSEEMQPVMIRKTPKFPSRERHLAIRRRKPSSPESQKSECFDFSIDSSDESSSLCSCDNV